MLLDAPLGRAAAPLPHYLWLLALILPVWVGLLAALGAYGVRWTVRSRAWLALRVSVIGLVLLTAGLFLVKESEVNRSMLALFAVVSGVGLWVERGLVRALAARRRPRRAVGPRGAGGRHRRAGARGSSRLSSSTPRPAGWCGAA